ncbi:hypothetical protein dsx2_2188 [Desulfovibrio sp. X2]|uniref:hypothetical protein n=1 Tax=Desulfovibrio sp. X2 TaxID=941449 RepID=UPI000358C5FC|nr:hypothetical protein [Desulfovibrio sp. X2]EPR43571.1 hypothetical protein dsx2_2188 [Desulfovibrio sp. X2]
MSDNPNRTLREKAAGDALMELARQQNDRAVQMNQLARDVIRQNRYLTGELSKK